MSFLIIFLGIAVPRERPLDHHRHLPSASVNIAGTARRVRVAKSSSIKKSLFYYLAGAHGVGGDFAEWVAFAGGAAIGEARDFHVDE
jgi:hypothetical protein